MGPLVKPCSDLFIRFLLGSPGKERILLSFVNAVREDKGFPRLASVEVMNPFHLADYDRGKESILDIKARDEKGRQYNIEVQAWSQRAFINRTLYYWAQAYAAQLPEGGQYPRLKPVVSINLVDFVLHPDLEAFHTCFILREKDHAEYALSDHQCMHYLELPKTAGMDAGDALRRWMYFFRNEGKEDEMLKWLVKGDDDLRIAHESYDGFVSDPRACEQALAREKFLKDQASLLAEAEERGLELGEEKGRAQGARETAIETARRMKQLGITLDLIVQATGLSAEEAGKL